MKSSFNKKILEKGYEWINDNQKVVMQSNVNSFYSLLRKANEDNSILIYASSAATYGNLPSPQTVGFENPENTYGFSKYIMDQRSKKLRRTVVDIISEERRGHFGSAMSSIEILRVFFDNFLHFRSTEP